MINQNCLLKNNIAGHIMLYVIDDFSQKSVWRYNLNKEVKMNVADVQDSALQTLKQEQGLQELVYSLVTRFLAENKSKKIDDLYDMILAEVEPPLLQAVMERKRGNQLQAAKLLGLSRGTIRKKLQRYFGTKYFRLTDE